MPNTTNTPLSSAYTVHQAFQVLEGQLTITMSGYTVNLIPGDTAFVPAKTEFSYMSKVAWTKVYAYAPRGTDCLVTELLARPRVQTWNAPVWPLG